MPSPLIDTARLLAAVSGVALASSLLLVAGAAGGGTQDRDPAPVQTRTDPAPR